MTSWLSLKADAIAQRAKGKDAHDVVWLLTALGPEFVAGTVAASEVLALHPDDVRGQLQRLVGDLFRDPEAVGPGLYAAFDPDAPPSRLRRDAVATVGLFGAALREAGVLPP